jgi:hypothetical protein
MSRTKKSGTAPAPRPGFNVVVVAQAGRLQYEAALFCASFRAAMPDFPVASSWPNRRPGPRWSRDPRISDAAVRALVLELGRRDLPFESKHFGESYPYGNKIECLSALPAGEPFVFFDSDTLILGDLAEVPFDFDRPSASLRVEGTWPQIELYGPGYTAIWKSLYDRFGVDFESSLDLSQPDEFWRRYLYFNAGFFYYRCPHVFGSRFLEIALGIRDDPPPELVCQSLDPWLDQVALPLVIHDLGGGRDALQPGWLDGSPAATTGYCHCSTRGSPDRVVELLERIGAPNRIKKVLKAMTR